MVTVDYKFYTDNYWGTLDEATFNKLLVKATKLVSQRTNGAIDHITDDYYTQDIVADIRYCICEVLDKVHELGESSGKVVKSRSAGKVSESYSISDKVTGSKEIADIIIVWLSGYGYTNMIWI